MIEELQERNVSLYGQLEQAKKERDAQAAETKRFRDVLRIWEDPNITSAEQGMGCACIWRKETKDWGLCDGHKMTIAALAWPATEAESRYSALRDRVLQVLRFYGNDRNHNFDVELDKKPMKATGIVLDDSGLMARTLLKELE